MPKQVSQGRGTVVFSWTYRSCQTVVVTALLQVWQVKGGQNKYTGHCCNFPRDVSTFDNRVPLLPRDVDIIILRRKGTVANIPVFEDFRVRRQVMQDWLGRLQLHYPPLRNGHVVVDQGQLDQLPEDGNVYNLLRSVENEEMTLPGEEGPPQGDGPAADGDEDGPPLPTRGFVPNICADQTEMAELRALLPDQPILIMPVLRGTLSQSTRDYESQHRLSQVSSPPERVTLMRIGTYL